MRKTGLVPRRGSSDVAMTPMIDVVFLLLVFFVWTASFRIAEKRLPGTVALPPAGKEAQPEPEAVSPEEDFEPVVIRISWNGRPQWRVQETPVDDVDALTRRLATIFEIRPESVLVIHPDSNVPLGHVLAAYDAARRAGFRTVRFATPREETS